MHRERGFSLLEMVVSMSIMLAVTAGVFTIMNPSQGVFSTQPEVADMQQRLRVAQDTLYKDLVMTGGGAYQGSMSGSLLYFFAPVLPYRQGTTNDDPPGSFICRTNTCPPNASDIITLMYVPPTMAQTTLSTKGPSLKSAEIGVNAESGCPPSDALCGFKTGMTVMIYDDSGNYDVFEITNVQTNALHIQHNNDKLTYTAYDPNTTKIVQASYFEYYLKADNTYGLYQLMFYDGTSKPDTPVVDNVVGLSFEYYGEPQPPIIKNPTDASTKWVTTYGPKPKLNTVNCVFDAANQPQPTLATLGPAASGLVKLTAAQLTDGPWCPNATSPNRWDADLLRIRKIGVTVRVQAAAASMRGPASVLFSRGGTSVSGSKWVPDQEVRFFVTPRNLNLGR